MSQMHQNKLIEESHPSFPDLTPSLGTPNLMTKPLRLRIFVVAFAALCSLSVYGFVTNRSMFHGLWTRNGLGHLLCFTTVYALLAVGIYIFLRDFFVAGVLTLGGIVACGAVGMAGPAATVYFLFSSLVLGRSLMEGRRAMGTTVLVQFILSILLGSACFMTLIGLFAGFRIHYPIVHMLLLSIPIVFAPGVATECLKDVVTIIYPNKWEDGWTYAAFALTAFILLLYLFFALLPEVGFDSLTQHLQVPTFMAVNHYWTFDFNRYVWAVMPMGSEWIYTSGYLLGGEFAARLLNLSFFIMAAFLLKGIIRTWVQEKTAWLLTVLYISTPFFRLEIGNLFIDNLLVVYLLGAAVALSWYHERQEIRYLFLTIALAAASLATKVIGAPIVAILLAMGLYLFWVSNRSAGLLKLLICSAAIFAIIGLYPYFIAYVLTKNPVFPFMNALFKSPYYATATSFRDDHWRASLNLLTLYNLTFKTQHYGECRPGAFGFQYLILAPLGLLSATASLPYLGWISIIALIVFVPAMFHLVEGYIRYLYPALPFATIVLALAFREIKSLSKKVFYAACMAALLITILDIYFIPASGWHDGDFPITSVFSPEARERYVQNYAPQRRVIDYMNARYGHGIRAAFLSDPFSAGFLGEAVLGDWHGPRFHDSLENANSAESVLSLMQQAGITHFVAASKSQPDSMPPPVRSFLEKYTESEYRAGDIYLSKLKLEYETELLINGNFHAGFEGWSHDKNVVYKPHDHSMLVSQPSPLSQRVAVDDKSIYRYAITARCFTPDTYVRIQVNWINNHGFCGATILPQKCGMIYKIYTADLTPPQGSIAGEVYVGSHGKEPVEVNHVSFKRN